MKEQVRNVPYAGMGSSGMALVLVLVIVALLTAMVVEFAYGVYVNTSALYNWQNSIRLSFAAKSGVRLGSRLIQEKISLDGYTPGSYDLAQPIPSSDIEGTLSLRIEDEDSKFNLNLLGPPSLGSDKDKDPYACFQRLLKALELTPDIADRITYWINPNTEHKPRDFRDLKNASKGSALDSVDELLMIPGIDAKTYEKLRPYVTIYGSTKININGASVPVLMSLSSQIDRAMAERILKYREVTPFVMYTDLGKVAGFETLYMSLNGYTSVVGTAFRVTSAAESGGISRIIDCVLGSDWTVKYWKEI